MVHRVKFDDQKATQSTKSKDQKLVAGSRVADKNNNMKANKSLSLIKPETTHSLFLRGCARLELKQYLETRKAIADFTHCIELLSQNTVSLFACELFYKRAFAYQDIGNNNDAIKDYTESINRCRSLAEQGKSLLLKSLVGRGQSFQAMYKLGMAFRDIDEANNITDDTDPYYLCCRASVYASKRDHKKAVEDLEKAFEMGSNQDVEALLQRASVLSELGKYDVALTDLERALTLSHENVQKAEIYFRRGLCDYALKNKDQALSSFEQAIKLNPFHARAYFRIGMIQAEKGQLKEALRTLTKAHELAPHQRDILLERGIVNRKLGKADDAADDVNSGLQLGSSAFPTSTTLEDHIKKLREDIKHNGSSARSHLELGMAYDGLLTQEHEWKAKKESYKEAIVEYRAAIETDLENVYPQARALLALCQKKMNDVIKAHESHLEFYNMLAEHKEAVPHWKTYLKEINEKMELSKLEPHLDENAVRKLMHMERNRITMKIDEENYKDDAEDRYKNQLAFYIHLRNDLLHVLAAIGLSNLDSHIIAHNLRGRPSKIGNIVELLSGNSTFVPEIESILNGDAKASTKVFQKSDFEIIKKRLELIESVGDTSDQVEIAQLVARHMCTRYRSQLICLKPNIHSNIDSVKSVEEVSPSKSWWSCCSKQVPSQKSSTSNSNWNKTVGQIATFATAFIIQAIISETIRSSTNENLSRREALASMLVLILCRAHRTTPTSFFQSINFNEKNNLLIEQTVLIKMLRKSKQRMHEAIDSPIEWDLYEFFQAPGIYYYSDDTSEKISYYGSGQSMNPYTYGYRLGTQEEVAVFEE